MCDALARRPLERSGSLGGSAVVGSGDLDERLPVVRPCSLFGSALLAFWSESRVGSVDRGTKVDHENGPGGEKN